MNRILTIVSLCLILMTPLCARSEDIVSTWRHKNGNTMTLAMRNATQVRMDTGKDQYILLTGDKVYMVTRQEGRWTAMDMDMLAGMMSQFGIKAGTSDQNADAHQTSFRDTGRSESVAGYKGTVYVAETKNGAGQVVDRSEVVFSRHRDVELAGRAWLGIAARLGDIVGAQASETIEKASEQARVNGYGGMLRIGEMTLVSIKKPSLEASYFDLPAGAEIIDMKSLPGQ
jgi:hypothetical protein